VREPGETIRGRKLECAFGAGVSKRLVDEAETDSNIQRQADVGAANTEALEVVILHTELAVFCAGVTHVFDL
jgi:hypothetical protein